MTCRRRQFVDRITIGAHLKSNNIASEPVLLFGETSSVCCSRLHADVGSREVVGARSRGHLEHAHVHLRQVAVLVQIDGLCVRVCVRVDKKGDRKKNSFYFHMCVYKVQVLKLLYLELSKVCVWYLFTREGFGITSLFHFH